MATQARWLEAPRRQQAIADLPALVLIPILWFALELLVNPIGNFPTNDDWVYGLAVQSILRGHGFALPSPATANVIAQAYWGALFCLPFGFSFTALRFSTLVLAVGGSFATYGLTREGGGTRQLAWLAALTLMLNPIQLTLANGFMTDVPFVSLTAGSLWLFARAQRPGKQGLLGWALLLALISVMVRQLGLIFVLAIGLAHVARERSPRSIMIALGGMLTGVVMHLWFQHWLLASGRTPLIVAGTFRDVAPAINMTFLQDLIGQAFQILPYIGWVAAPLYLATGFANLRRQLAAQSPLALVLLLVLLADEVVLYWQDGPVMPDFGNVLMASGVGPLTLRDTYLLGLNEPSVPPLLSLAWPVLLVLGTITGAAAITQAVLRIAAICAGLIRGQRDHAAPLDIAALVVILLYCAAVALIGVHLQAFDRYMIVLIPPFALLMARLPLAGTGWQMAAAFLLLGQGGFAVCATHDYLAWQRGRQAATQGLEAAGVRPTAIDGGYEYNGRHLYRSDYRPTPSKSYWWVQDDTYVVASGPMPGYREIVRYPYTRWIGGTIAQVVTLRRNVLHAQSRER
ncbi:MAG: glycosyltransferase family 39 protein [Sphingomonadales bacterium]|nr:glycosyltransferase family 39 protein [Sphingomonadales bacterium]MDE2169592.1 glycosyltransferase family 39 protein [Sphingomonadales bacterium]